MTAKAIVGIQGGDDFLVFNMPLLVRLILGLSLYAWSLHALAAAPGGVLAHWAFEDTSPTSAHDPVSRQNDAVSGYARRVEGVHGQALRLDGYTTGVTREASLAPRLPQEFSFEAWVALEAYPWGLCPIISQFDLPETRVSATEGMTPTLAAEPNPTAGYFFGLDANGHLVLQAALDGTWRTCRSLRPMPLLRWNHVAGVRMSTELVLFLNGEEVGRTTAGGIFTAAVDQDLLLGRNPRARPPQHPIRLNLPALYAIEGLLDEVKVHAGALSAEAVRQAYTQARVPGGEVLTFAPLPDPGTGRSRFGAWTTRLTYKETWDAPRREGPASDVVVHFDEHPFQYVFWRGTNYIPHWITENGIWYTNEFNETWNNGALGCAEPMSDKQARFSRVQILESNDARVVVHWRYAWSTPGTSQRTWILSLAGGTGRMSTTPSTRTASGCGRYSSGAHVRRSRMNSRNRS